MNCTACPRQARRRNAQFTVKLQLTQLGNGTTWEKKRMIATHRRRLMLWQCALNHQTVGTDGILLSSLCCLEIKFQLIKCTVFCLREKLPLPTSQHSVLVIQSSSAVTFVSTPYYCMFCSVTDVNITVSQYVIWKAQFLFWKIIIDGSECWTCSGHHICLLFAMLLIQVLKISKISIIVHKIDYIHVGTFFQISISVNLFIA